MSKDIRDALETLVNDIEEMRCEVPTLDLFDNNPDAQHDSWFGPFSLSDITTYDDMTSIQWPNLKILLDKAKEALDVEN